MADGLWVYVNVDGVPDGQQLPLMVSTLKRIKCRSLVTLRRAKRFHWVQLDGFSPEEAEVYAPKISEDFETEVLMVQFASVSSSLRYLKWEYQGSRKCQEVARWVYNCNATGWETCQGRETDRKFALILAAGKPVSARGKRTRTKKPSALIRPAEELESPSLSSLGTLLKLPGIDPETGGWIQELDFRPEVKQVPQNLFELFRQGDWDTDDITRLIAEGADVNQTLGEVDPTVFAELREMTPLEAAIDAIEKTQARVASAVKTLLEAGADPNRMGTLSTPLYQALDAPATPLTVRSLLAAGAKVDRIHDRDNAVGLKDLLDTCVYKGLKVFLQETASAESSAPKTNRKPAAKKLPKRKG